MNPLGFPQHASSASRSLGEERASHTKGRQRISAGEGSPWAASAPDTRQVPLWAAICQVFDPSHDRLLWPNAQGVAPPVQADFPLRFDRAHEAHRLNRAAPPRPKEPEHDPSVVGGQLAELLTRARERGARQDGRWIIAVVSAQAWTERRENLLPELAEHSRCLVIVLETRHKAHESAGETTNPPISADKPAIIGPVDGGDFPALVKHMRRIQQDAAATVLRVRPSKSAASPTTGDALEKPIRIDPPTTTPSRRAASDWASAAREESALLAQQNSRAIVVSLTPEFAPVAKAPSTRSVQVEQSPRQALQWCGGLASGGDRPVALTSLRTLEQSWPELVGDICEPRLPVTLLVHADGDSAASAAPAHALLPNYAALRAAPDLTVMIPANRGELRAMLEFATSHDGPTAICLPSGDCPPAPEAAAEEVRHGEQQVRLRGCDLAILAWGPLADAAERAGRRLSDEGILTTVLNMRFLTPLRLDESRRLLDSARCALVVDDDGARGGCGAALVEALAGAGVDTPVSLLRLDEPRSASNRFAGREPWLAEQRILARARSLWSREEQPPLAPAERASHSAAPTIDTLAQFGISPDALERERELIARASLSEQVRVWYDIYSRVGHRNLYLWRWCVRGAELTTLPCVDTRWREHLCDTKILSIMLCVLLDDVADERGKGKLLETLLAVVARGATPELSELSPEDQYYAQITDDLAQRYEERIRQYPRYREFEDLLRYDLLQYFNTMRFSNLLNGQLHLLNSVEHDLYLPHAMHMMSFATLDLMGSSRFDARELGVMRELIWHLQRMARLGNLLSTWQREIRQKDFTSGVFARAVRHGDLTVDQLRTAPADEIEAAIHAGGHEAYFLRQWRRLRERARRAADQIRSVELGEMIADHEKFFYMHLACRGKI